MNFYHLYTTKNAGSFPAFFIFQHRNSSTEPSE
jgi:hypothetical protein